MPVLPFTNPVRYVAANLPTGMTVRLERRGARAFAARIGGDVTVTLPSMGGAATFLVPRGFGHPLPARRAGVELRAEPGGEPCSAARWVATGGVAAWMRHVPSPRGPAPAVDTLPHGASEPEDAGLWIYVRPTALAWSAARLRSSAAGHGTVAVADRRIVAASPLARAAGIVRGMSRPLALRRCPSLVLIAPVQVDLRPEVHQRLVARLGPVQARRTGFLARLPLGVLPRAAALDVGERLARILWQELGVEVQIAIAGTEAGAVALAGWLEPGWVAVGAPGADAEFVSRTLEGGRYVTGTHKAAWRGPPSPDLEGAVARASTLAGALARTARGASVRVSLTGVRGARRVALRVPLSCGRRGLVHVVEALIRREGAALGGILGIALTVTPTRLSRPGVTRSLSAAVRAAALRAGEERTHDALAEQDAPHAGGARHRRGSRSAAPAEEQLSLLPWRG